MLRSAFVLLLAAGSLAAQSLAWELPAKPPIKRLVPRTWRITSNYQTMDLRGAILARHRVSALYTREGDRVRWNGAEVAFASDATSAYGPGQRRAFMEGFTYPYAEASNMMKVTFLKGFPQDAALERNLVWDTHMFEFFGQDWLRQLRLNEAFRVPLGEASTADLAGTGTFRHTGIELTWTGQSQRHGQICAVVDYRSFHNTLEITVPSKLKGRSHYWGQIWISQETGNVEYGTLFEDVLAEMTLPGQTSPMMINIFRTATFEPLGK